MPEGEVGFVGDVDGDAGNGGLLEVLVLLEDHSLAWGLEGVVGAFELCGFGEMCKYLADTLYVGHLGGYVVLGPQTL